MSLHDLNPKLSAAYDVAGDGKTALKVSLNRYVEQYTVGGVAGGRNPINRLANSTTRSWNDANRNYTPDCVLVNLSANGECGAVANQNFGSVVPEQNFDQDILEGWGKRTYNWELTAGVQRELLPRLSADFTYFRRWYGNLHVVDNRAVSTADFNAFSITAPSDPRLPDGGGYPVSDLYDVNPARFGQVDNITTFAKNFGDQVQMWNGVALTVNSRLRGGLLLQGGVDTGRYTTDTCEIRAKLPEIAPVNPFCRTQQPTTQFKLGAMYMIPRVDVQVSGALAEHSGAGDRGELHRDQRRHRAVVGTASFGRDGERVGQSRRARDDVRRAIESAGSPRRQDSAFWRQLQSHAELRCLQRAERRYRSGSEQRLRDVAAAAVDPPGALREAGIAAGLLSTGGSAARNPPYERRVHPSK